MSRFAAAIGALVLLAGGFITYINSEVLDPDAAGQRASQALQDDPALRAAIAPQVTDAVGGIPLIGGLASGSAEEALATPAAANAFGNSVSTSVEQLTSDPRPDPLELNLADVATGVSSSPLDLVTGQIDSLTIDLSGVDGLLEALDLVDEVSAFGTPLLILGVLLLLAAVLLAPSLRDGLMAAGISIGVAGVLGIAILVIARTLLGAAFDNSSTRDAVVATWDALGGDLLTLTIIGTVAGFVVGLGSAIAMRGGPRGGTLQPAGPAGYDDYADEDRFSPEYQAGVGTEPYRRPPPPPPPPPPRRPARPDDPPPPDQDFGRRRYR